jgi:hypothetical protein
MRCVQFRKARLFRRNIFEGKHRICRAYRYTGPAIDAGCRIDKELGRFFETGLIFLGVNAVYWTSFDAQLVLRAGIGNYICHISPCCNSRASA